MDLKKNMNPDTAKALEQHENKPIEIYKSIFVSNDLSYHVDFTVNLGNDIDDFSKVYDFLGKSDGFITFLNDYTSPIITKAMIDGQTPRKVNKGNITNSSKSCSRNHLRFSRYILMVLVHGKEELQLFL